MQTFKAMTSGVLIGLLFSTPLLYVSHAYGDATIKLQHLTHIQVKEQT